MKYFALVFLVVSFMASANESAKDAKKFCEGIDPGKGQLAWCLCDYQVGLSPQCATALKTYEQNTGKKTAFFEELAEFWADLPSVSVNYEYCLLKNENRLGAKCSSKSGWGGAHAPVHPRPASDLVSVRQLECLLWASFRACLTTTPFAFHKPSRSSGG